MKRIITILLLFFAAKANAIDFEIPAGDDSIHIEWTNTIKHGVQYRTQKPSRENTFARIPTGSPFGLDPDEYFRQGAQSSRIFNGNDGNLKQKWLVSNRFSFISDLNVYYKDFGVFGRMRGWYDTVYQGDSDGKKWPTETRDYLGANHELLDLYLYTRFDMFERPVSLRIGRQVIGWGESLAFPNSIMSAINPVDAVAGTAAGIDLKEITLPTEAVYMQMALTPSVTLQAYGQWKHRPINMVPAGSFWSQQDFLGRGGKFFDAGGYPLRRNNVNNHNMGQWGLALRWMIQDGTEFGLYGLNYHDKAASFTSDFAKGAYNVTYKENIALYGFSFSTAVGDVNLSGELSYRRGTPLVLDSVCIPNPQIPKPCYDHPPGGITNGNMYQAQVSFVHIWGNAGIADQVTTTGELMGWVYSDVDDADLSDAESLSNTNTPKGMGSLLRTELAYFSVLQGMNVLIPITWQYGIAGTNLRSNSQEQASIFSAGLTLDFDFDFKTGLVYTQYDGASSNQFDKNFYMLNDRDNISFFASYSF